MQKSSVFWLGTLLLLGCSSRRSDIDATCSLGASELAGGRDVPAVVQPRMNADEKVLDSLPEQQQHETEDCLACIALACDPEVVWFLDRDDGVCDHLDVATCQAHGANSGVEQLWAFGCHVQPFQGHFPRDFANNCAVDTCGLSTC